MSDVIAALIPVFAIIALGTCLRAVKLLDESGWRAIERLTTSFSFPVSSSAQSLSQTSARRPSVSWPSPSPHRC